MSFKVTKTSFKNGVYAIVAVAKVSYGLNNQEFHPLFKPPEVNTKEILEPIFLKEVPTEVYPKIEKIFLDLLNHSGYQNVKFESKVDFNELYKKKGN